MIAEGDFLTKARRKRAGSGAAEISGSVAKIERSDLVDVGRLVCGHIGASRQQAFFSATDSLVFPTVVGTLCFEGRIG